MTDAPLYIDLVLWAVYVLIVIAVAATVYAAVHGVRTQGRQVAANRLYTKATIAGIATPVVVMALSYAMASTTPLTINGQPFTSSVWLRLSDMFIYSSAILIVICFAIVIATKFRR